LSNAFSIAKLDSISIKEKSNSAILIDLSPSQQKAKIHFYDGSFQNESSCASLLAARAKSQSEVQRHVKFIIELISEGAWNAPTIFQTFRSTVAFTRELNLLVQVRCQFLPIKQMSRRRIHQRNECMVDLSIHIAIVYFSNDTS